MYPDSARPNLGLLIERQTLELATRPNVEIRVVAPILTPLLARFAPRRHPLARALRDLPERERWKGLDTWRPRAFRIPRMRRFTPALLARQLLPLLRRLRADFPFDLIDAEIFWPDGVAAMILASALGIPFSIKARGGGDIPLAPPAAWMRRQLVRAGEHAAGMLAVSEDLRAAMIALGLPAERIAVHLTGVDPSLFHPGDRAAAKAALGLPGPILLVVGTLGPRKGQSLAIRMLRELPAATLILVGWGPVWRDLAAEAARLGVADRLRLLGSRPQAELPGLYRAADVTLLPSRSEGLANSLVESLACGTPVVTTLVFGAGDIVDRPEAGRIVARDPAAFAAAVRALIASPPAPESLAAATAAKFSWASNAEQLEAHLRALVRS
ncbi:MAG TPA: glycosyltransferase [Allosphingosinicella sp.]|nr:glycosyltransferase [Allosphingosinicella sp.]